MDRPAGDRGDGNGEHTEGEVFGDRLRTDMRSRLAELLPAAHSRPRLGDGVLTALLALRSELGDEPDSPRARYVNAMLAWQWHLYHPDRAEKGTRWFVDTGSLNAQTAEEVAELLRGIRSAESAGDIPPELAIPSEDLFTAQAQAY